MIALFLIEQSMEKIPQLFPCIAVKCAVKRAVKRAVKPSHAQIKINDAMIDYSHIIWFDPDENMIKNMPTGRPLYENIVSRYICF